MGGDSSWAAVEFESVDLESSAQPPSLSRCSKFQRRRRGRPTGKLQRAPETPPMMIIFSRRFLPRFTSSELKFIIVYPFKIYRTSKQALWDLAWQVPGFGGVSGLRPLTPPNLGGHLGNSKEPQNDRIKNKGSLSTL